MWEIHRPVHCQVSTRVQRSQPDEDLDDQIESGSSVCTSKRKDAPKFSFQWQCFRKPLSLPFQSCFLDVLKIRLPKYPAEESLPASYPVPDSGSFEDPESNSVAKQEHAAYPPQNQLYLCWKFKVPTYEMYGSIRQGCNTNNCFLISLEVGEPIITKPRHWSLDWRSRNIHEGLHVQRPTWTQIVDKIEWCLFPWPCRNLSSFPVYLVYGNLKVQLNRSPDIVRFM